MRSFLEFPSPTLCTSCYGEIKKISADAFIAWDRMIRCVHMCTHILVLTLLRSNTYFDAIIALKIGHRLAIIKIVKKSSMGLCCLIFS